MIAPTKRQRHKNKNPAWHEPFLKMLPAILRQARIGFHHLDPESRAEAVQAVIANACVAFHNLWSQGKADVAFAGPLANYAIRQVRDGRSVGGKLNVREVLSRYSQRRKRYHVERLDRYDYEEDAWQEIVVEDRHAGPDHVVMVRLDFAAWLASLSRRNRRIAEALAAGERTGDVARRFGLCPARVSQLRSELAESWEEMQGEAPRLTRHSVIPDGHMQIDCASRFRLH